MTNINNARLIRLNDNYDNISNFVNVESIELVSESANCAAAAASDETNAAWSKQQSLLTIVSYVFGTVHVWGFPRLCYLYGGAAFLIPYLLMVLILGAPLLLIELGIGQILRVGSFQAWYTIHPCLGGIGIASTIIAFAGSIYYSAVISLILFYLVNSFSINLPWLTCPLKTNVSENAEMILVDRECNLSSTTVRYFFYRKAMGARASMDSFGGINWPMAGCFLVAWILIYLAGMRGIRSAGKVLYFTAICPYLALVILCIPSLIMPGASEGILYYFKPTFELLYFPQTWFAAALHVFYSFGIGYGSHITFGSLNKPKNNFVNDTMFISIVIVFTSIFAAVVVYSIQGIYAFNLYQNCLSHGKFRMTLIYSDICTNISRITDEQVSNYCNLESTLHHASSYGYGLMFMKFNQIIGILPFPTFWSIIFYLMLLTLAIGTQIGLLETVINAVSTITCITKIRKEIRTAILCGLCFLLGSVFFTNSGYYWIYLINDYIFDMSIPLITLALMEIFGVSFVYARKRFLQNTKDITGYYPSYCQICWIILCPLALVATLIHALRTKLNYDAIYPAWDSEQAEIVKLKYPKWALAIIVYMLALPIVIVSLTNYILCLLKPRNVTA